MSFRGYGADSGDPFDPGSAGDPFDTSAVSAPNPPPGTSPGTPGGEVNTLATLSVVFAFVFAPAGVVLGHVALSQLKHRFQPGRHRAVLGLTISYVLTVLAIVALLAWLLLVVGRADEDPVAATPAPAPAPSVRSTVITPPTPSRPKVSVANLQVGDCVEIQKNRPDPSRSNTDQVYIFRTHCEVRDGVFQVQQKATSADECPPGEFLTNEQENIVACFVKYGQ